MDDLKIDQIIDSISKRLHLSKEAENEILAEIRSHLEDAVAEASANGGDEQVALLNAAEQFKDETGEELQAQHSNWESIDAILATALPVLFALILRWLAFAPDGSPMNWPHLLVQPGFYLVAMATLILPLVHFRRWRYVLVGWGVFWLLTVIFVIFPSVNRW